ncbi:MAG: trypsin-like peptidase domain-containing protein [Thermogutta sp.]
MRKRQLLQLCWVIGCFVGLSPSTFGEGFPTQVLWATVKIMAPGSTATGFLVQSPRGEQCVLVSANHVFSAMKADECTVLLHTRDASGNLSKNPQKLPVRKEGQPLWTKHPREDVAAIPVPFSADQNLAVLPWEAIAFAEELAKMELQPGDVVRSVGYPHGNMFKGNDLEFGVVRLGCLATYPFPPSEQASTFLLDTNTFEGDSGGPVYVWKLPSAPGINREDGGFEKIIGLVVAQHFLDEQFTLIYQSGKFRHRMGLAIVVPSTFIRETVELALKRGESGEQPNAETPSQPVENTTASS